MHIQGHDEARASHAPLSSRSGFVRSDFAVALPRLYREQRMPSRFESLPWICAEAILERLVEMRFEFTIQSSQSICSEIRQGVDGNQHRYNLWSSDGAVAVDLIVLERGDWIPN